MAWVEECIRCLNHVTVRKDFGAETDIELDRRGWQKVAGQGWVCPACQEKACLKNSGRGRYASGRESCGRLLGEAHKPNV